MIFSFHLSSKLDSASSGQVPTPSRPIVYSPENDTDKTPQDKSIATSYATRNQHEWHERNQRTAGRAARLTAADGHGLCNGHCSQTLTHIRTDAIVDRNAPPR